MSGSVRRAFTLIELLIVIAIIGLLVALMGTSLTMIRQVTDQSRCAANLYYLSQAIAMRRGDSLQSRRPAMKVVQWPRQLLPYVDYKMEMLICPAAGGSETVAAQDDEVGGDPNTPDLSGWGVDPETLIIPDEPGPWSDIAELAEVKTVSGGGTFLTPMTPGPYCIKFSEEQYETARAQGLLGNDASANHIRTKFNCTYSAGANPDAYWLCFEDYGGDDDFKDVMIRVTDNRDGTFDLWVRAGGTGHQNSVVGKPDGTHLLSVPSQSEGLQLTLGEVRGDESYGDPDGFGGFDRYGIDFDFGEEGGVFVTNYGMNAQKPYLTNHSGKVVLMDYCKYLARSTDVWSDPRVDPNQDGVPMFARHQHQINVLFSDGSVTSVYPGDINPALPSIQHEFWDW